MEKDKRVCGLLLYLNIFLCSVLGHFGQKSAPFSCLIGSLFYLFSFIYRPETYFLNQLVTMSDEVLREHKMCQDRTVLVISHRFEAGQGLVRQGEVTNQNVMTRLVFVELLINNYEEYL